MTAAKELKSFYSCPDTGLIRDVPQAVQHQVIGSMADQLGGKVTFYTMEDYYTMTSQEVIREKVAEKPKINGIIFFRLSQFFRLRPPNVELMNTILRAGYELHFAREKMSIRNDADLERLFPIIYTTYMVEHRDKSRTFFAPLVKNS